MENEQKEIPENLIQELSPVEMLQRSHGAVVNSMLSFYTYTGEEKLSPAVTFTAIEAEGHEMSAVVVAGHIRTEDVRTVSQAISDAIYGSLKAPGPGIEDYIKKITFTSGESEQNGLQ